METKQSSYINTSLIIAFSVADIVTTFFGLKFGLVEVNSIVTSTINNFGFMGFVMAKAFFISLIIFTYIKKKEETKNLYSLILIIQIMVVFSNIYNLWLVKL